MYTYLLINSVFSLLYSLILSIKCLIKYLDDRKSFDLYYNAYLSPKIINIQYLNVYLVKFCSNVFRTGANISYFAFVLSRYIAVTKSNIQTRLNKFNTKLNSILFILITLVISVSINVYIIFDFEIISSILGNQLQSISMKKFSS